MCVSFHSVYNADHFDYNGFENDLLIQILGKSLLTIFTIDFEIKITLLTWKGFMQFVLCTIHWLTLLLQFFTIQWFNLKVLFTLTFWKYSINLRGASDSVSSHCMLWMIKICMPCYFMCEMFKWKIVIVITTYQN